jgi:hypothetical protein
VDWHEYYRLLRKLIRQSQPRLAYA